MGQYLTPKKFLKCCGIEKCKAPEMILSTYLSDSFLAIPIYHTGTFDSYFISQTEVGSARFFLDPPSGRHSLGKPKAMDLSAGLTEVVLDTVVSNIDERIKNPVITHPDLKTMLKTCEEEGWHVDKEALADIKSAEKYGDSTGIMILLLAALTQDYYSLTGVNRKVRAYMDSLENICYPEVAHTPAYVRETNAKRIGPVSDLRTEQTYVRRADLLKKTEEKLSNLALHGEKQILFLYGAPGEGKSELARAYAREHSGTRYRKEYLLICPDGDTQLSLFELCKKSAYSDIAPESMGELQEAGSDVLLVVDNCNTEIISLINELYYHTGDATVLVTSRLSHFSGFDSRNALLVHSDHQDTFCYEVFRKNYQKAGMTRSSLRLTDKEEEIIRDICQSVYLNPMFVAMIASFLREHSRRISMKTFRRNLEKGIVDAFPKYSQLDFRKDASEPMRLEPLRVLEIIFREELRCIRSFTEEERQVINLMILYPAEKMPISLVSEILGDTEEQWLMGTTIEQLQSLSLLQYENDRISIHPLFCELLRSGVTMEDQVPILYGETERDAFYTHVLQNFMLLDKERIHSFMYIFYCLFHAIGNPSQADKVLYYTLTNHRRCRKMLREEMPELTDPSILAFWKSGAGKIFLLENLQTKERKVLLDLSNRRDGKRYFNIEAEETNTCDSLTAEKESYEEAVLLLFYQGTEKDRKHFVMDLSDGIAGHGIHSIPHLFFRGCGLNFSIQFPEGLKRIGDWAFDSCSGLAGELKLPESLEYIGRGSFHGCMGLKGELKLPKKLKVLEEHAFFSCSGFSGRLVLPDGLEYLGNMAFGSCRGLVGEVNCPPSLKLVGENPFHNCQRLKRNQSLSELPVGKRPETPGKPGKIFLPDKAEILEDELYFARTELTGELKMPQSVREIGEVAFYCCGKITGTLDFPSTLQNIGAGAFGYCSHLSGGIDLPDTLEAMDDAVFMGCTGLDGTLRLPRSLKTIPVASFYGCSGLKKSRIWRIWQNFRSSVRVHFTGVHL